MPPLPDETIVVPLRTHRPLVAIMAEKGDVHARALARYIRAGGASAYRMRLSACGFDAVWPCGIRLPGFQHVLPDAVLVRTISAGTFEQVTLRLGILHALRDAGVLVWNDARAIERCVDKSTTMHILASHGLPVPQSWSLEGRLAAEQLVRRELSSGPLVLKPLFGAQGRGLKLIRGIDDLPEPDTVNGVYHLQRFVGDSTASEFTDYRVMVIAGQAATAMRRRSAHWITNVKQGGEPVAFDPPGPVAQLAVKAAQAVGADYCGVDILPALTGPVILEVNSMPAWSGLQKVTKPRISAMIARSLLDAVAYGRTRSAAV